jgi:hypothetical protein
MTRHHNRGAFGAIAVLMLVASAGPARAQDDCRERLDELGIAYRPYTGRGADVVEEPVRLRGPVGGVEVTFRGRSRVHAVLACPLVLALHRWAPALRRAGIRRLEHFSAFRPGARIASTGRPSGHSRGLAIDVGVFHFDDGSRFEVLTGWVDRDRGEPPCEGPKNEPEPSRGIRALVCRAFGDGIFQVVVTPHHDDAHANHVHLEVVPDVPWTWIR